MSKLSNVVKVVTRSNGEIVKIVTRADSVAEDTDAVFWEDLERESNQDDCSFTANDVEASRRVDSQDFTEWQRRLSAILMN